MKNLKPLAAAAIVSMILAGPAMARHATASRSTYCSTIEPGNPYSRVYDYLEWTNWRRTGSWDSRGDDACARNPAFNGRF
jgi:hypothetical protein